MKTGQKAKYFILGMAAALLVSTVVVPAGAALAQRTITVQTGVNIYVDDQRLEPRDSSGNPVEPFIYNGTTYLPVRAIGEAYGKTVQWVGKSQSVYIGKHDSEEPAAWLADLDYFTADIKPSRETTGKDNLGDTHYHVMKDSLDTTWMLNGQYSKMTGVFYQKYERRTSDSTTSLEIYADDKLVYTAEMDKDTTPIEFNIDLTGVLKLRVDFGFMSFDGGSKSASLGDCALYT